METNVYRPEASSFALKRDVIKARRARSALVVGSRSSWSFRNWTLRKATLLAASDGAAVAAEGTPTVGGPKARNAASPHAASGPQPGASRILRRERRRLRPASAATPDAALASEPFIVSSLSGSLWSPIGEASGRKACPVGPAIAV